VPKRLPSTEAELLLNEPENFSIITIEQIDNEEDRYSNISEKLTEVRKDQV